MSQQHTLNMSVRLYIKYTDYTTAPTPTLTHTQLQKKTKSQKRKSCHIRRSTSVCTFELGHEHTHFGELSERVYTDITLKEWSSSSGLLHAGFPFWQQTFSTVVLPPTRRLVSVTALFCVCSSSQCQFSTLTADWTVQPLNDSSVSQTLILNISWSSNWTVTTWRTSQETKSIHVFIRMKDTGHISKHGQTHTLLCMCVTRGRSIRMKHE